MPITDRPQVIVDPYFRAMGYVFSREDVLRLGEAVEVVSGLYEPIPVETFRAALPSAFAIVSCG